MAIAKRYQSPGRIASYLVWGAPLQIQVGWSRSPQGAEHNECWKPELSIASIVKATSWAHFLCYANKHKHNTNYGGTAALGVH